jgi:dolichol-phosphate mannosyltransferase
MSARTLVAIFAYNEAEKLRRTVERFRGLPDCDLLIMDDGSDDGSVDAVAAPDVARIRNPRNLGVGYSLRRVLRHARDQHYQAVCLVAGNDKDRPEHVAPLVAPILSGDADFVQGSRYAPGGQYGNMPLNRYLATRYLHPWLVFAVTGRRLSDTTNGFRALRPAIIDDPRIRIDQPWLDRYELEPYLLYKILVLGYRVRVVPVTKIYPAHSEGYTKIRPFTGWWSILKPFVLVTLGLKK